MADDAPRQRSILFKDRNFKSTAKAQAESALVQLPTEIRVKILRKLLRNELATRIRWEIKPDGSLDDKIETNDITTSSAQLLRTCQSLFYEGIGILYGENRLQISCPLQSKPAIHCHVLNGSTQLPANGFVEDCEGWSVEMWLKRIDMNISYQASSSSADELLEIVRFRQNLMAMHNFERYEIQVGEWRLETNFYVARILSRLIQGKDVVLMVPRRLDILETYRIWNPSGVVGVDPTGQHDKDAIERSLDLMRNFSDYKDTLPLYRHFHAVNSVMPLPKGPYKADSLRYGEAVWKYDFAQALQLMGKLTLQVGQNYETAYRDIPFRDIPLRGYRSQLARDFGDDWV